MATRAEHLLDSILAAVQQLREHAHTEDVEMALEEADSALWSALEELEEL